MTFRVVQNQAQLNEALLNESITAISIEANDGHWISVYKDHGKRLRARDQSRVELFEDATIHAFEDATIVVHSSGTVIARDRARVVAYGYSTVHAFHRSHVEADDRSVIVARDSAVVRAWVHARVFAHGNSTVYASDPDEVVATGGATVKEMFPSDQTTAEAWCANHGVTIENGHAILYKALDDDITTGVNYGKLPVVWTPGAELVCRDWRPDNRCGGGLHLSPTPTQAGEYRSNATRWMRVLVDLDELRPIDEGHAPKAKARVVRVDVEVDEVGRELPAVAENA